MSKPIALTSGDPAGIAPEITQAAWEALKDELPFFVIGDRQHFPGHVEISAPSEASDAMAKGLPLLHLTFASAASPGQPNLANSKGVIDSIRKAVIFTKKGEASAICTNPISKELLIKGAGFAHPGHTEFLAELGGVLRSVMLLTAPELSVVPTTIHIPLSSVKATLTRSLLQETLLITYRAFQRDFGIPNPRIAVSGLNPHAGEGGIMGQEEITIITPVLDQLRRKGLELSGPFPADTMFHPEARAGYDVAVCMYHDQALIPIKTLNFSGGVNVTLGLPFIRTSPDHGTAFGIAGKGLADPTSLIAALRQARDMAAARALYNGQH